MGKTRKYCPGPFRRIKGKKKALIGRCRYGAVPPDSWDDISPDKQAYLPFKIAMRLRGRGKSFKQIRHTLTNKFGLKDWEVNQVLETIQRRERI